MAEQAGQGERQATGGLFNAFIAAAERQGLLAAIRKKAPPGLLSLIDRPRLATSLVPGTALDELYPCIEAVAGRPGIRAVARDAFKVDMGQLLKRLFDLAFQLHGTRAEALFLEIATIAAPITRGFTVSYEPAPPRSGWVIIRPHSHASALAYAIWEGVMEYFFEVAGEAGEVSDAELNEDGSEARILVRW